MIELNKPFHYATGRIYDFPQVLEITITDTQPDFADTLLLTTIVHDRSRHMNNMQITLAFMPADATHEMIGRAALASYDAGSYF